MHDGDAGDATAVPVHLQSEFTSCYRKRKIGEEEEEVKEMFLVVVFF